MPLALAHDGKNISRRAVLPIPRAGIVSRLGFFLFLLINVVLLIRPQEVLPQINVLNLYALGMVGCLLLFWPVILRQLAWARLRQRPITICVLFMAPMVVLSTLWQGRMDLFENVAVEYCKIVLYYLVCLCVLDTPVRLRGFVLLLGVLIALVGLLPLADYFQVIQLDSLKAIRDVMLDANGKWIRFYRLRGVGIFNDPNDLAQILGVGVIIGVYALRQTRVWLLRAGWLLLLTVMLYAIYLTQSRGGMLALAAGLGVLFACHFGWKKAAILGLLTLPVLVFVLGSRNTQLESTSDTSQKRVQLWSDTLVTFREAPVFGVGAGGLDERIGQVAHNSFLQAYAETGIIGGYLFFTAYLLAIKGLLPYCSPPAKNQQPKSRVAPADNLMASLAPVLLSISTCYVVGMLSLTRNYVIPTYLVLALAASFFTLTRNSPANPSLQWKLGLLGRCFAFSMGYLLLMQVFVQLFVRWK